MLRFISESLNDDEADKKYPLPCDPLLLPPDPLRAISLLEALLVDLLPGDCLLIEGVCLPYFGLLLLRSDTYRIEGEPILSGVFLGEVDPLFPPRFHSDTKFDGVLLSCSW